MNPFTSFTVGSQELPNRLIMAPVKTGFATAKGEVTSKHLGYYARRAEGGVGAIIVEPFFVDQSGKEHPKQIGISEQHHVTGLRDLAEAIHAHGAKAIAHINHAGRAANPKASGKQPEAPSEVKCPLSGVTPSAMTVDRIKEVVTKFADAAGRAKEAGFDIIEVQFGLGYLISQFISSHTNLRTDEYGGSVGNRYRFAEEIIQAIQNKIGDNPPLIARLSASEQFEGGQTIDDAINLSHFLKEHGIAALHVASGAICDTPPWYYQYMRLPMGKNLGWASRIKKEVDLPVIAVGRMGDPADIRKALDGGAVDAVALGRPLVADPDLPRKMKEDRDRDVLQCGACLQGCLGRVKAGKELGCIVNPEIGHESDEIRKSEEPKTVVVVGGGPGGMQAAMTASQRGHRVILFDEHDLGGQFNLCYLPPGKRMMERPLTSLVEILQGSPVELRLSKRATKQDIVAENPDLVIIATGAVPVSLPIPGLENPLTGEDVLTQSKDVGKRVCIIGGGMIGLETAEFLVKKDHQVTVVELLEDVGRDMLPVTKNTTLKSLNDAGTEILTSTRVTRLDGRQVFVESEGNERLLGKFDTVVVAVGTRSVNDLESVLREAGIDVRVIGDAKQPRQIYDAVMEGYEVSVSI